MFRVGGVVLWFLVGSFITYGIVFYDKEVLGSKG